MAALAGYRTRVQNSLNDTTTKYSNDILDESIRKSLNEYTRAFPNILTKSITLAASGRSQSLATCATLINVIQLVHPYDSAAADPFIYEREDFSITWESGSPVAFFSGPDIPLVNEKIFVKYAGKQTIKDLDSATDTTVRDDHENSIVMGSAGQAAMIRASGLNEAWGGRASEMSQLMLWGSRQYERFLAFLAEIRTEQALDIFPDAYWRLDQWDDS